MANPQGVGMGFGNEVQSGSVPSTGAGMQYAPLVGGVLSFAAMFMKNDAMGVQLEMNTEAVKSAGEQLKTTAAIAMEQSAEIDRNLGDAMSQRSLDALKAEASLKAGAAETGTSGGTTSNAIRQANVSAMLDNQVLQSRANQQQTDVMRRLLMDRVSFKNKTDAIISATRQQGVAAKADFLQGASSFMEGANLGLAMMSNTQKEQFFGSK